MQLCRVITVFSTIKHSNTPTIRKTKWCRERKKSLLVCCRAEFYKSLWWDCYLTRNSDSEIAWLLLPQCQWDNTCLRILKFDWHYTEKGKKGLKKSVSPSECPLLERFVSMMLPQYSMYFLAFFFLEREKKREINMYWHTTSSKDNIRRHSFFFVVLHFLNDLVNQYNCLYTNQQHWNICISIEINTILQILYYIKKGFFIFLVIIVPRNSHKLVHFS